jgi:hypothetical protein
MFWAKSFENLKTIVSWQLRSPAVQKGVGSIYAGI